MRLLLIVVVGALLAAQAREATLVVWFGVMFLVYQGLRAQYERGDW